CALRDLSLQKRGPLLPEFFKFVTPLARADLCLLSARNVEANSCKPLRFSAAVHLHAPTLADPAHSTVRGNNTKLNLVIFAVLDGLIQCLPNFVAIFCVPAGNQMFGFDCSRRRETQLSTVGGRDPDFIFFQIHSHISRLADSAASLNLFSLI